MDVVIVGHGPSLKGAGLGKKIDTCDQVVRLKNCHMLLAEPHDYGRRTDILCSSTEVLWTLDKVKAQQYWGYPKLGTYNRAGVRNLERKVKTKVYIPLEVCNLWNCVFLEMGGQHKNVSTGMGAVIIALHKLTPNMLYLAGFDNVLDPSIEGYTGTVPTAWNNDGKKDTGHDWRIEHAMLPYLAASFNVEIKDLAGSHKFSPARV